MKGEKNDFYKGLFISLGIHLLIVCLLALGVGSHRQVSPEKSVEVSLSTRVPHVSEKKPAIKAPTRPRKQEKNSKKIEKTAKKQVKPPKKQTKPPKKKKTDEAVTEKEKKPDPPPPQAKPEEKPKQPAVATDDTPPRKEPETQKKEDAAEKKTFESDKKEVLRDIKKESVLSNIKKNAEQPSVGPVPKKESDPGVISLVLDVYYKTISRRIQEGLILPLNINSDILLAAKVNFYMTETGEVYDVGIETSSGNMKFDSYCIKAVNDSSPFPPPPDELRERIKSDFFIISCEGKK